VTPRQPLFTKLVWDAAADALLGTQSDRAVGRLLGVNRTTVASRRQALGIPPWQHPKRLHQGTCVYCGEPFAVVGGRASQMRTTCPPPKDCLTKLVQEQRQKTLALAGPAAHLKRVSGLKGLHFLTDKDDDDPDRFTRRLRPTPAKRRRARLTIEFVKQVPTDD